MFIFAFSLNPDTKEAAFTGNITARQAINIMQDIVIAEEIKKVKDNQVPQGEQKPKE